MRHSLIWVVGLLGLACPLAAGAADPPKFEFKDGDRVVLLGDTLIERDQKYGYFETLITIAHPDKSITFRNLGWSGDTVRGTARAFFGTEADGFKHLREHVLALKPTVIIVGYGMADSFDGEAGLPRFVSGLNTLLDALAETKARTVLLSPIPHEDLGRPLPDPTAHNLDLKRYSEAIGKVASSRGMLYLDTFDEWDKRKTEMHPPILSDDGIHLTEMGYLFFGVTVAKEFGCLPESWQVNLRVNDRLDKTSGTKVTVDQMKSTQVQFQTLDINLPFYRSGFAATAILGPRLLAVKGLAGGHYILKIDGNQVSLGSRSNSRGSFRLLGRKEDSQPAASDQDWNAGVPIIRGPEYDQVERLRKVINEKNLLYFHRWRPQNETYLFGFRKHEQGNNAREIPLFDPLVEEREKEIAKLRKPVPHTYELVRESEVAK